MSDAMLNLDGYLESKTLRILCIAQHASQLGGVMDELRASTSSQ
ncbi:MAG: hypothetical protein R3C56_35235 [Pirellulaceae bacterium]